MYKELRDTITRAMPTQALGLIRPRGLLMPLDPWMRGTTRFASKLGGQGSIWRPSTRIVTNQPSGKGEYLLYTNSIWKDLVLNSVLRINSLRYLVSDYDDSDVDNLTVTLSTALEAAVAEGDFVYLYAFPVTVEGGLAKGATSVRVASPFKLARGDRVELPIVGTGATRWQLTVPLNVEAVDFVEEDVEGLKYILTLEKGVPRDVAGDETIWMRAYPAYFSGNLTLPLFGAIQLNVVGPFLVDFMSGPLVTGTKFTEFVSLTQRRIDGTPLTPVVTTGDHNLQINRIPIRADQFMFWTCIKGKLNWDGTNVVCLLDSDGEWRLRERMAPHLDIPGTHPIGAILAVAKASLVNNDSFTVPDGNLTTTFEFKVDSSYTSQAGRTTIDVSAITTVEEVSRLIIATINTSQQADIALTLGSIANNDRLVVSDGDTSKTLEFKIDGTYLAADPTYVTVDVSASVTDDDAATVLEGIINAQFSGVNSEGIGGATGIIRIVNAQSTNTGMQLQSSDNPTAISVGSFQRLDVYAQYVNGIINLINNNEGATGNVSLTESVANSSFVVSGMTGGGGGLSWIVKLQSDGDGSLIVHLWPNDAQVFPLSAGTNTIEVTLAPDADPITHFDLLVSADLESATPITEVRFGDWQLAGSRVKVLDASIVVRVDTENYAASAIYLKPLWPNLDLLRTRPDFHEVNSHSIIV